jgi:hypothetical protein
MLRIVFSACLAAALSCLLVNTSRADFLLVGQDPNTEQLVPFGLDSDGPSDPSTRYQQIYNANLFGHSPISITTLTFYATPALGGGGTFNPVSYQFSLSTTTQTVAGLSTNMAANVGSNSAAFRTVTSAGSAPAVWTISGTPFVYDPSKGNLLLDIQIFGQTSTGTFLGAGFDGLTDFGGASSSVSNFISPIAATPAGLVTGLTFNTVPAPPAMILMALGLGGLAGVRRLRRRDR